MEEIVDFDEWLKIQENKKTKYFLIYHVDSGNIKSVCPENACSSGDSKIEISEEMAQNIFSGEINPGLIRVNHDSQSIEFIEDESIIKIDSILHRVLEKENNDKEVDVYILYNRDKKELSFQLTKAFGGTYLDENFNDLKIKEPFWESELTVEYMIGDLNDPNVLHETISLKISEMIGNIVRYENIELPEKFSIYYSKRILRNQIFEII